MSAAGVAEAFRRDGAVPIRGLLTPAQVETLRAGIDRNRAEPGPLAQGHGIEQTFFEDFCNWERIGEYAEVIRDAGLGELAAELMADRSPHEILGWELEAGDPFEADRFPLLHPGDQA